MTTNRDDPYSRSCSTGLPFLWLACEVENTQLAERERLRQLTDKTSFPDFLKLCLTLLTKPLRVETRRSLTTKGSIISPKGNTRPSYGHGSTSRKYNNNTLMSHTIYSVQMRHPWQGFSPAYLSQRSRSKPMPEGTSQWKGSRTL